MKLLIFSDIHNNWKTLEDLLGVDADFYIAAGDQVSWGRGLDRCGEILSTRGSKVYVLPGNHESASQVSEMCARYGLHDFHQKHMEVGRWQVAGLGYSSPTPFETPGEYSEPQLAERLERFAGLSPLVLICHTPALRHGARPGPPRSSRGVGRGSKFHREASARVLLLRPHPRSRGRLRGDRQDPRVERRQEGLFVRIGLTLHDSRRTRTHLSAPPRPGPGRSEVSLTPPRKNRN